MVRKPAPFSDVARLEPHAQRARVLGELHARPFAALKTPCRILHYGFMTDAAAAEADREALAAWLTSRVNAVNAAPGAHARHFRAAVNGAALRWESHSEFTTYTWEYTDRTALGPPFAAPRPVTATISGAIAQPGPLMVAVDLHLVAGSDLPVEFQGPQFAVSVVEGGAAVMATDFQPDADGHVRILVIDRGLGPDRAGPLVQRALEVETYRTLALLGLPEAQARMATVRRVEAELPELLNELRRSDGAGGERLAENQRLLDRLSALSADLEATSAALAFRIAATRAYHELVRLRLEVIDEAQTRGGVTWAAFLNRRLDPAVRTCIALEERQNSLSQKLARAGQLLRTRVDIALERQNQDLLRAVNERVQLQLRLQQTVEGLSVAAITYYSASLFHLMAAGARRVWPRLDPELATALAAPVFFLAIARTVRRVREAHEDTLASLEGEARKAVSPPRLPL